MESTPKTVLVTGASRGIGAAIARLFAVNGYQVVINYHKSRQEALALARELSAFQLPAIALEADVADRTQVDSLVEQTLAVFGGIDVLVNNAGIAQQKLFTDVTTPEWERMCAVDLGGVFHCCQAVLPHMIHEKRGSIINISSIWGIQGASCEVAYSAVKAGVIGLTKALAQEVGPSGIRVNCVAPGVINTEMNAALGQETLDSLREETPLGIIGEPKDVAESVLFLAGEKARFITGQVLSPNGGFIV